MSLCELVQGDDANQVRTYVIAFFVLAVITFFTNVFTQGLLGLAGERLTYRVRSVRAALLIPTVTWPQLCFRALLAKDLAYYDNPLHTKVGSNRSASIA